MTVLNNSIHVQASPEDVWAVLSDLDALQDYDPGVKTSIVISSEKQGVGAVRKCELAPKGWFNEKVVDWTPNSSLAFELVECSLPLRRLRYTYKLTAKDDGTLVEQRMEYALKMGLLGRLMDNLMVRRKWNAGIRGFFSGLKDRVEDATTSGV